MKYLVFLTLLAYSISSYAVLPATPRIKLLRSKIHNLRNQVVSDIEKYQIGEVWGKHEVTAQELENKIIHRAALGTASVRMGGATSFYIGKFNGYHVMATNYHVYSDTSQCVGRPVRFISMNKVFKCVAFLGAWSKIDLALYTIDVVTPEDEAVFAQLAGNFAFKSSIHQNQPLLTLGYGLAMNPSYKLTINYDSDCRVFSGDGEFVDLKDPDTMNPAPYTAVSFSNGCDISHGDSGSAVLDRSTGALLGLVWTGATPKDPKVRSEDYLLDLVKLHRPEIWTQLSYAIPAPVIGKFLQAMLSANPNLPPNIAQTIQAMLLN